MLADLQFIPPANFGKGCPQKIAHIDQPGEGRLVMEEMHLAGMALPLLRQEGQFLLTTLKALGWFMNQPAQGGELNDHPLQRFKANKRIITWSQHWQWQRCDALCATYL